jgi:UPF0716 family protein affecting phage T7 exclusion
MYGDGPSAGTLAATGVAVTIGGHAFGLGWLVLLALALVALGVVLLRIGGRKRRYLLPAGAMPGAAQLGQRHGS